MKGLIRYDAACRAIAAAKSVDEVKDIRDVAVAMKAYARQAKNKSMEADAAEIRLRATRRIDQMRVAQKESVGLAKGGEQYRTTGVSDTPVVPTLAEAGIDKNLAKEARELGAFDDDEFEDVIAETRGAITGAVKGVVRRSTKKARRDKRVAALTKNLPDGLFVVFVADCPWRTETWSEKGMDRAADNHYPTMSLEDLVALGVPAIAAKNAVLFMWATGPHLRQAMTVLEAWGFEYKTILTWDKVKAGTGKWLFNQTEHLLICTRGNVPAPGDELMISSLYRERRTEHSAKPEAILDWIDTLFPTPIPKVELFRRGPPRPGWAAWGNEVVC